MGPKISIVVACSRPQRIRELVRSVACLPGREYVELILVGKIPAHLEGEEELHVKRIPTEIRHPNHRRNLGVRNASCSTLCFVDDDCQITPSWLQEVQGFDPDRMEIWTGPEVPSRSHPVSQLIYWMGAGTWVEKSFGHFYRQDKTVPWYAVPFCNIVLPLGIVRDTDPLSEEVPWDSDDIEFCFRVRRRVRFVSRGNLQVLHDRYPERLRPFLKWIFKARVRTGAKMLSMPQIYWRIPPIVVSFLLIQVLLLVGLPALPIPAALTILALVLAAYLFLGLSHYFQNHLPFRYALLFPFSLLAYQVTTVAGVEYGFAREILRRICPRHFHEARLTLRDEGSEAT